MSATAAFSFSSLVLGLLSVGHVQRDARHAHRLAGWRAEQPTQLDQPTGAALRMLDAKFAAVPFLLACNHCGKGA
jgi:hypothetical protein